MTISNVTVGLDGSPASEGLLRWADELTARSAGRLQAVTAWHLPYLTASADLVAVTPPVLEIEEQTRKSLSGVIEAAPRNSQIEPIVSQGGPARVLMDASATDDLLIVGRRGTGSLRALGSTSRHCAIHASCPVAVVPTGAAPLGETPDVAVAVDGSHTAALALAWVLTNFPGAAVAAFNSQGRHDVAASKVLGSTIAAAYEIAQVEAPVEPIALEGDPRASVLEAAKQRELLVVGDRGHGGVAGLLLGSFATYAVGHAPPPLPVVVVRSTP